MLFQKLLIDGIELFVRFPICLTRIIIEISLSLCIRDRTQKRKNRKDNGSNIHFVEVQQELIGATQLYYCSIQQPKKLRLSAMLGLTIISREFL